MESIAPTATPTRKRKIRSTGELANRKSASEEEDVFSPVNSKHLRIHDYFFHGEKSMGISFE
jgi:hypothetical protein